MAEGVGSSLARKQMLGTRLASQPVADAVGHDLVVDRGRAEGGVEAPASEGLRASGRPELEGALRSGAERVDGLHPAVGPEQRRARAREVAALLESVEAV